MYAAYQFAGYIFVLRGACMTLLLCTSGALHCVGLCSQGPDSGVLMTGGSDRGSCFIPQKIPTSEFVYPRKSLRF